MQGTQFEQRLEIEKQELMKRVKELQQSKYWVPNGDDPCKMFKMPIGERIAAMGVHVCPFRFNQVVRFLWNIDSVGKLSDKLKDIQILYSTTDAMLVYQEYWGAGLVSNRDFVNLTILVQEPHKAYIMAKDFDYPCPQKAGVVRGKVFVGGYIVQKISITKTKVTFISDSDLMGWIPNLLKNSLTEDQAGKAYTVEEVMKEQIQ